MADINHALDDAAEPVSTMKRVKDTVRLISKEVATADGTKAEKLCVTFATNSGKGSGAQVIPVDEFQAFVATLRESLDSGFEQAEAPAAYRPAAEVAADTMCLHAPTDDDGKVIGEPDCVSFRTRTGKGVKPARIPLAEVTQFVEYLETRIPVLNKALANLQDAD